MPPSTTSSHTRSAASSPVCGRASTEFSIFTASAGRSATASAGTPVSGQAGGAAVSGPRNGSAGKGCPAACQPTTPATASSTSRAARSTGLDLRRRRPFAGPFFFGRAVFLGGEPFRAGAPFRAPEPVPGRERGRGVVDRGTSGLQARRGDCPSGIGTATPGRDLGLVGRLARAAGATSPALVSAAIPSRHGHDSAPRRSGDRSPASESRTRGAVDAGGRPPGGPRLHRAEQQAGTARSGARRGTASLRRSPGAARSVIYLDLEDLLHVAQRTLGDVQMRDPGLLESAATRPRSTAFGDDAYPSIHDKAASLLHSIARNHPLVDGNKRLALAATIAFYGVNGLRLTLSNDEAYDLVMAVAAGQLDDVEPIAERLRAGTAPWA